MISEEGPGFVCDRMKQMEAEGRVIETAAWLAKHAAHGPIRMEDAGHPSGNWVRRICPCGAKHVGFREDA